MFGGICVVTSIRLCDFTRLLALVSLIQTYHKQKIKIYISPYLILCYLDCGPPLMENVEGNIYSPNYPRSMPTLVSCEWRVQVKGKGVCIVYWGPFC